MDQYWRSHSVGYPKLLWLFQYWEAVKICMDQYPISHSVGYAILLWLFQYWEAVKISVRDLTLLVTQYGCGFFSTGKQ